MILTGAANIAIDGQGSTFIFHGDIVPFNLEDATNFMLRNFSVDWHRTIRTG